MKGYKAFEKGWICRDMQYEIGGVYELPDGQKPIMCKRGYHYCANPIDVFGYYPMIDDVVIAEVEAQGEIVQEGTKYCTNKIRIVKEFTREQLQCLIRDGRSNTGSYNSGNYNSGYLNSGDYNSGDHNSGDHNSGNYNSGYYNSGNYNSGNYNSGYWNSGDHNSGDHNSGYYNSGNYNSGYYNSGNYNSGDHNSGYYNSGDHNSGYYNSGYYNSGDHNSGIFNTNEPNMRAFNAECDMTMREFLGGIDYDFMALCEKIHTKRLKQEDIDRIKALPNYNADIFHEITGIDMRGEV